MLNQNNRIGNGVILAPHIDDDVIGCWSALRSGEISDVFYLYDINPDRKAEATLVSKLLGFTPHFGDDPDLIQAMASQGRTFYVPHIADNHSHHKLTNIRGKSLRILGAKLRFYSVDMNAGFDVLQPTERDLKRSILRTCYPSQQALLEDEKYHLFENIVDCDYKAASHFQLSAPAICFKPIVVSLVGYGTDWGDMRGFHHAVSPEELLDMLVVQFGRRALRIKITWHAAGEPLKSLEHGNG